MQWSDIDFRPPDRKLRQFGVLCSALFAGLACWSAFVGDGVRSWTFGLLTVAAGVTGWLFPQALRVVYAASMAVTFPIGWLVSNAIMVGIFFGLFLPLGLVFRAIGRDTLMRFRKP